MRRSKKRRFLRRRTGHAVQRPADTAVPHSPQPPAAAAAPAAAVVIRRIVESRRIPVDIRPVVVRTEPVPDTVEPVVDTARTVVAGIVEDPEQGMQREQDTDWELQQQQQWDTALMLEDCRKVERHLEVMRRTVASRNRVRPG